MATIGQWWQCSHCLSLEFSVSAKEMCWISEGSFTSNFFKKNASAWKYATSLQDLWVVFPNLERGGYPKGQNRWFKRDPVYNASIPDAWVGRSQVQGQLGFIPWPCFLANNKVWVQQRGNIHKARGMPITLVLCYLHYTVSYTWIDFTWYPVSLYNYHMSSKIPKEGNCR